MSWSQAITNSSQAATNEPPLPNVNWVNPNQVVQLTGTSTQSPPFTFDPDPCAGGHHLNEDLIEYIDGTVVGNCATCATRVVIDRVPGGVSLLRVKALLASLMSLGTENEVVDESEILGLLSLLQKEMEAEEYALEEVREMMDLCHRIVRKRIKSNE